MNPIQPSPGRIVWYHPASTEKIPGNDGSGQPLSAQVARVNADGTLNLSVLDANAVATPRLSVLLVQPNMPTPDETASYCYWMPYQVGQAKKEEPILEQAQESLRDVANRIETGAENVAERIESGVKAAAAKVESEGSKILNEIEARLGIAQQAGTQVAAPAAPAPAPAEAAPAPSPAAAQTGSGEQTEAGQAALNQTGSGSIGPQTAAADLAPAPGSVAADTAAAAA